MRTGLIQSCLPCQYCILYKEGSDINANYFMPKVLCIRSPPIKTARSFCRNVQFVTVGCIHDRVLITCGEMK